MAPTQPFAGALPPKKKQELQEIASALNISDQGTKDEIQTRIKKHLDENAGTLESNPTFAGLYTSRTRGKRQTSVQPVVAPPSTRFAPPSEPARSARLSVLEQVQETPQREIRSVSTFLKATDETPVKSAQEQPSTPSSLPPLPPSPFQSIISRIPAPSVVLSAIQSQAQVAQQQEIILQSSTDLLHSLRTFLSNSRNIWSLSVLLELFSVLYTIISWESYTIPLAGKSVTFTYPPLETVTDSYFWTVLLHWSIPSLFIPAIVGSLISFSHRPRPQEPATRAGPTTPLPNAPFDPLSASISRLAIQLAYPYATLSASQGQSVDPLGSNLRLWSASVSVAFAFAEAISGAPEVVVREVLRETQKRKAISYHDEEDDDLSVVGSPRKQITTGEDEVD